MAANRPLFRGERKPGAVELEWAKPRLLTEGVEEADKRRIGDNTDFEGRPTDGTALEGSAEANWDMTVEHVAVNSYTCIIVTTSSSFKLKSFILYK